MNLRAWLAAKQPALREVHSPLLAPSNRPQELAATDAQVPQAPSPDFAGLRTELNKWMDAIWAKDVDSVLSAYSLRSAVLGRWFTGQDAPGPRGGGIIDRATIRGLVTSA